MSSTTWIIPSSLAPSTPAAAPALGNGGIDHISRAISRLPEQFKNSTVMIALLKAMLSPAQEIEDTFYALLAIKSIDSATAAQLDLIGKLVGQDRNGNSDTDYRKFLKVKLAANRSRGLRSDYVRIVQLLFPTARVEVRAAGATAFVTVHGVVVSNADAAILMQFLTIAHGAGVRVDLATFPQTEDTTFTYRWGSVLNANVVIGGTSFTLPTVRDVVAMPRTGFVKFMTTNEVVAIITAAPFTSIQVLAPGFVQNHTAGEIVEVCDSAGTVIYPAVGSGRGYGTGLYANGLESIDT